MRRRTGLLEDLIEAAALLPWQVGVGLAVLTGWVLHVAAETGVPYPGGVAGLGGFAGRQPGVTLAQLGQYVLPLAFPFGAWASFLRRRRGAYPLGRLPANGPWRRSPGANLRRW